MCGRYALSRSPDRYADYFDADLQETLDVNYNVAPTDPTNEVAGALFAEVDEVARRAAVRCSCARLFARCSSLLVGSMRGQSAQRR